MLDTHLGRHARTAVCISVCAFLFTVAYPPSAQAADSAAPIAVFRPAPGIRSKAPAAAVAGRAQAIVIQLEPLRSSRKRDARLRMDFLDESVVVERRRLERGTGDGIVWYGRPVGREGTIVISTAGDIAFGRIELENKVYKIEPLRGTKAHMVYELDPSKEKPLDNDVFVPPLIEKNRAPIPDTRNAARGADDGSLADVLIVYTNGFAAAYPGDALDAEINFIVGVANAAYDNSLANLRLRVVDKEQVTYADGGALPLSDLRSGIVPFDNVAAWRDQSGADMISLIRVFKADNNACGVAYIMTSLSSSFAPWAYSVVQVGSDGGYYCTDQTFAHELGHNMGSHHNLEDVISDTDPPRLYPYSVGMEFPQLPSTPIYRTVMAYNKTGTSRVSYFTNPNVQYNGYTTGVTDQADNARSIGNSKLTVTQWRSTVPLFADVPTTHYAWEWIEGLYRSGITSGCGTAPLTYCPSEDVTRAQMAVLLERGMNGASYTPPPATGTMFGDVAAGDFAAAWIEQLAADGIASGCGGGDYCPNTTVDRAQMAVFLLRAKHGAGYTPPACTGTMFGDVPSGSFACDWIEQLATEGITSGCGGGNYCPAIAVDRAQMAVFLIRAFGLPY